MWKWFLWFHHPTSLSKDPLICDQDFFFFPFTHIHILSQASNRVHNIIHKLKTEPKTSLTTHIPLISHPHISIYQVLNNRKNTSLKAKIASFKLAIPRFLITINVLNSTHTIIKYLRELHFQPNNSNNNNCISLTKQEKTHSQNLSNNKTDPQFNTKTIKTPTTIQQTNIGNQTLKPHMSKNERIYSKLRAWKEKNKRGVRTQYTLWWSFFCWCVLFLLQESARCHCDFSI